MKTIISKINIALCIMLSIVVSSCDDENKADVVKPVINLIEPEDGEVLLTGEEVHFELELSDDVMLGSYKVEIHNNFDGHDHSTRSSSERTPFSFNRSWDLSGKKNAHIHHHEIEIPEDAATGEYHLMVYCTDAAGNESYVARRVIIRDEE